MNFSAPLHNDSAGHGKTIFRILEAGTGNFDVRWAAERIVEVLVGMG